jgi:hypothetical protein
MARVGTTIEASIPLMLILSPSPGFTLFAVCIATVFHGWIAANNPAGMPIEWNIVMVYGAWFLFGMNPEVSPLLVLDTPILAGLLFAGLVALPAYGNFVPSQVSFLLAMRYYAGNWAYTVWLFRDDAVEKLDRITKASGTMRQQLDPLMEDKEELERALMMSPYYRYVHLQGRPLLEALPQAVDDIERYEWMDGEVLGGIVVGWNFGDGHLHDGQLLRAVQEDCGFDEGELRVICVEGQPLFGKTMAWQVLDAKTGLVAEGETEIGPMRDVLPWPTGEYADALSAGSRDGTE